MIRGTMKSRLSRSFLLLAGLSAGSAGCVTTYMKGGNPMYMMQDNCMGCEAGDTAVHPAVVEYVLSRPQCRIADHYRMVMAWQTGAIKVAEEGMFNKGGRDWMLQDLQWLTAEPQQAAFLATEVAARGGTPGDLQAIASHLADGELLARALARQTAPAAAQAFADVKRAQWFWSQRWEQGDDGAYDNATVMGLYTTVVIGKTASKTVELFHAGKGLDPTVPVLVLDVSELPGAFDPSAALTFEEVAAKAKVKAN
jgi:hypothetical protein